MRWWLVVSIYGVSTLVGTLAAITPEEHARRIARMREIAAQSHGKIEIVVEAYAETVSPHTPDTVAAGPIPDRDALFPRALHLIYTKQDQEALTILRRLLTAWPESGPSGLWHYWAGECCWNLGQLEKAAEHFSHVADRGRSGKTEQATLKLALIADTKEDFVSGRRFLAQLLHDYPQGDCVIIARPLLEKYGIN